MFSRRWRRTSLLVLSLLVSSTGVVMFNCLRQFWPTDRLNGLRDHQLTEMCHFRMQSDTFTQVPGTKTLLINAFREHRTDKASVRLLGIVHREEDALRSRCVFCCQEDGEVVTVVAKRTTHSSHFYFQYGTGDFLCQIPVGCKPRYAGLLSSDKVDLTNFTFLPVLNQYAPERSRVPLNYTLCMPTMFNSYNNVLQFIQAMELYQLLGIQRAIIYKTNCSATMETVLQYYSSKVVPWPIDSHLKPSSDWLPSDSPGEIHYYGQIPANNDCVYRNMYRSRYVLMHNPDEVILPTGNVSLETLMSNLEEVHGEKVNFYFPNNVFSYEATELNSRYDFPEWKHIPGNNMLVHAMREPDSSGYSTGKLVLDPRSVLKMEVHNILEHVHGGRTERIGPELGRLYRIRWTKQKKGDLVRDESLLELAQALVKHVNQALGSMGLLNTNTGPASEPKS